jgi:H+/Cl- antiporter ClcA
MKKGDSNMWWILVSAIIAILIIIFVIMWFQSTGGKGISEIDSIIDQTAKGPDIESLIKMVIRN